ncbi:hypothetical protein RSAG8_03000, partial [Rhizoctonia solani AG-8 WAC10335]
MQYWLILEEVRSLIPMRSPKRLKKVVFGVQGVALVDGEPNVPADHVLVKEPRAVVLPHVGSATVQTRLDMAQLTANNLIAGIRGKQMPSEATL